MWNIIVDRVRKGDEPAKAFLVDLLNRVATPGLTATDLETMEKIVKEAIVEAAEAAQYWESRRFI